MMNISTHDVPATQRFGRFLLDPHRRELLADGVPVTIGSRAFDVLLVLTEAGGQLVSKDELLSRVWPGMFVEENTLQFQISALRKALGPDRDFVKTIFGRGYRFTADISMDADPGASPLARLRDTARSTNLSVPTADLAGYKASLSELRLRLLSQFADEAWVAALGPLSDSDGVLPTVATALGLTEARTTTPQDLAAVLARKPVLVLLSIGV